MKKKDLLTQRIDALDTMSYPELKEKFRMLCSGDPGDTKSPGLRRRIAHRLQEIEYGSLSQEDRLKLEKSPMPIRWQTLCARALAARWSVECALSVNGRAYGTK